MKRRNIMITVGTLMFAGSIIIRRVSPETDAIELLSGILVGSSIGINLMAVAGFDKIRQWKKKLFRFGS